MTIQTRRYTATGPTAASIDPDLPGGATASGISVTPTQYLDVTLSDDAAAPDLDAHLLTLGWAFGGEVDPPTSAAKTIKQIVPSFLAADASQISVPALQTESDWVTVKTASVTTKGGTSVGVQVTGVGSAGVGEGRVRLLVNGGAFSDQVLGADYHSIALLSRGTVAFHAPAAIPATSGTTYDFELQMQATGLLGTLTPRKGSGLTCVEYA